MQTGGEYIMKTYIGIGFIILCLAVLTGIAGFFGYMIHITKKEFDIAPNQETSNSNNPEK